MSQNAGKIDNLSLCASALDVLTTADPWEKARKTLSYAKDWQEKRIDTVGSPENVPPHPARLDKPELRLPRDMPKRKKAGSLKSKMALLHALAHIELNAIDLAWDLIGRFAFYSDENAEKGTFTLPRPFYDDWVQVAADEAKHFIMISDRLNTLGISYGNLPAHGGLWETAERTAEDFAARLAVVPMVLEARGLDVTPVMIENMKKQEDFETANILQIIHDEEISHVAAGTRWFKHWCDFHQSDIETTWQNLVKTYFNGELKPPFNNESREKAGMQPDWYEGIA